MPPENGAYLAAAYIVAGTIYLGYAISLLVRAGRERRAGQRGPGGE